MEKPYDSSFRKNLRTLMERENITQDTIARISGISQAAVSKWLNGKSTPSWTSVSKLCDKFNLDESDLYSDRNGLYAKAHGLSGRPSGAVAVRASSSTVPVRVLGATHAGDPMDEDECELTMDVPTPVAERHPSGFGLKVEGDCMDRRYPEGCMVLVDPDMEPRNGMAVVAEFHDGRSVLRSYFRGQSTLVLTADSHSQHEDIVLAGEDPVRMVGAVVWFQAERDVRE